MGLLERLEKGRDDRDQIDERERVTEDISADPNRQRPTVPTWVQRKNEGKLEGKALSDARRDEAA